MDLNRAGDLFVSIQVYAKKLADGSDDFNDAGFEFMLKDVVLKMEIW